MPEIQGVIFRIVNLGTNPSTDTYQFCDLGLATLFLRDLRKTIYTS